MPSSLILLLTIFTMSVVPEHGGAPGPAPTREARLRVGPDGVPVVRVEVAPGRLAWFVVDTGATGTTIATTLADRLGVLSSGRTLVTTIAGSTSVPIGRLGTLRIDGVTVARDLDVAIHDLRLVRETVADAEGILGQDVLGRFDYLIDLERGRLVLGWIEPPRDGVRVPLSWSADRPVLHFPGTRNRHALVLDSGANVLVIDADAADDALGPERGQRRPAGLETHVGRRDVQVEHHPALRLADLDLGAVDVLRVDDEAWTSGPEVGLLPASVFRRVYVSARRGEAMVWER